MKKSLVIGSNTSKSLSPHIFNHWFKKYNIEGEYSFIETNLTNFEAEVEKVVNDKEICGFNVTIPFKELIKNKLYEIDTHSEMIGAVNFVSKIRDKWVGKNSDWVGFSNSINHIKDKKKKEKAMVLGFGGASKAIIYALIKFGFEEVLVFNRSKEKLKNITKLKQVNAISYEDIYKKNKQCSIVINTIPINVLDMAAKGFENSFGYDVVYKPKETSFLTNFKKDKKLYGISMLVHQAAPCFEAWYGVRPKIDKEIFEILERFI